MESTNDRPLPISFWNDITPEDRARAQALQHTEPVPVVPEIETWRASFAEMGVAVEDAMQEHYGKPGIQGVTMMTFEQVLRFLQLKQVNAAYEKEQAAKADPKEAKRALRKARSVEVLAAHAAWKDAIAQQQQAMAQWRTYVNHLHKVYSDLKNS